MLWAVAAGDFLQNYTSSRIPTAFHYLSIFRLANGVKLSASNPFSTTSRSNMLGQVDQQPGRKNLLATKATIQQRYGGISGLGEFAP